MKLDLHLPIITGNQTCCDVRSVSFSAFVFASCLWFDGCRSNSFAAIANVLDGTLSAKDAGSFAPAIFQHSTDNDAVEGLLRIPVGQELPTAFIWSAN